MSLNTTIHVCGSQFAPGCGFQTEDAAEMRRHMHTDHGVNVGPALITITMSEAEELYGFIGRVYLDVNKYPALSRLLDRIATTLHG